MLLALLLAASEVSADEPPARERTVAVWLQPIALTLAPVIVAAAGAGTYVGVPLGANLSFGPTELAIEATVYTWHNGTKASFTGGTFTIGPVLHTGDRALGGFMLIPKLGFDVMHELSRNVTGVSILPGIDFGWQRCFGPVYFALVLGISGGWSFADGDGIEGPGLNPTLPTRSRPVFGVNLNLLRIGGAF